MFIVNSLKHYRWGNIFLLHQIKEEHMNLEGSSKFQEPWS